MKQAQGKKSSEEGKMNRRSEGETSKRRSKEGTRKRRSEEHRTGNGTEHCSKVKWVYK